LVAARFTAGVRAVVQRVQRARVQVGHELVGAIDGGLLVLLCVMRGDTVRDETWVADKLLALRVFPDADGRPNRSILERAADAVAEGGSPGILVVSQFTLAADLSPGWSRGNRPAFVNAAEPAVAAGMVENVVARLRAQAPHLRIATGRFGADMQVESTNDGPFTLWVDTRRSLAEDGSTVIGQTG
jgi:D-tyrosyl-tRNA(Tyr) deacylase